MAAFSSSSSVRPQKGEPGQSHRPKTNRPLFIRLIISRRRNAMVGGSSKRWTTHSPLSFSSTAEWGLFGAADAAISSEPGILDFLLFSQHLRVGRRIKKSREAHRGRWPSAKEARTTRLFSFPSSPTVDELLSNLPVAGIFDHFLVDCSKLVTMVCIEIYELSYMLVLFPRGGCVH